MYNNIVLLVDINRNIEDDIRIIEKAIKLKKYIVDCDINIIHYINEEDFIFSKQIKNNFEVSITEQIEMKFSYIRNRLCCENVNFEIMIGSCVIDDLNNYIIKNNIEILLMGHHQGSFWKKIVQISSMAKNSIDHLPVDILIIPLE